MAFESEKDWWYGLNGQAVGPVPGSEIRRLTQAGTIGRRSKLWTAGMPEWIDAELYPDLFVPQPPSLPPEMPHHHGHAEQVAYAASAYSPNALEEDAEPVLRPAGFWIRAVALIVDGAVISGLAYAALQYAPIEPVREAVAGYSSPTAIETLLQTIARGNPTLDVPAFTSAQILDYLTLGALTSGIAALYFIILHALPFNATIGKALMGIRLRRPDGRNVGLFRSIWRYICTYISSLLLGIGFLIAGWNREKKALHDMLAGTRVVHRRS